MKTSDMIVKYLENEGVDHVFGIPVVTTFMGKGGITAESECYIGTLGLGRDRQIPDVFLKADLVIAVGYDLIKWKDTCKFGRCLGLDFSNPDLVRLAESFGAHGLAVTASDGMEQVLTEALSKKGPVVVDVPIDYTGHELLTGLL
jgi:thiamine pyrophosphate-dependent acetolactate synthase large subunit-like protein